MEKHPFFMTKAPEPGEELSPLMQGIQKLKYDEDENTPEGEGHIIKSWYLREFLFQLNLFCCVLMLRETIQYCPLLVTDLAKAYKDDGNFHYKCKKYRHAIIAYTEGLRKKCNDNDINAQLYNNRAASNFFLKNYR